MIFNEHIGQDKLAKDLLGTSLYFPVRYCIDGHEFVNLDEWGVTAVLALNAGNKTNAECGKGYAEANPIIEIVLMKVCLVRSDT